MQTISFKVQGSASEPYEVIFEQSGDDTLAVFCTCPAGSNMRACKHRIEIFDGNAAKVIDANPQNLTLAQTWFKGSEIEKCLNEVRAIERDDSKTKADLVAAKKRLNRALHPSF